jgi:hypothetical protein
MRGILQGQSRITSPRGARRDRRDTPACVTQSVILELGDAVLGRNGEIAAAAGANYQRVLERDPEFVDQMIDAGRHREANTAHCETA